MKRFWTALAFPDVRRTRKTHRPPRTGERWWGMLVLFATLGFTGGRGWAQGVEPKPLLFLADQDYPPMTYLEDGTAKGMDVDFGKALGTQMKRKIRIELTDWNLAQEKVSRGEADGLLGMSISEERRKQFDFSSPMFTREYGLLVRNGEMTIRSVSDLQAKNVGVTPGGFPKRFLETHPGVNLVLVTNYQDGLDRLTANTIDALAADLWVAAFLVEKDRVKGVTIAGKPFATAPAAMAVRKGNTALLDEINQAIRTLQIDGTVAMIRESWRPQEMLFVSRERMRGLITQAMGIGLMILVGVLVFWVFTLKRQVRIRRQAESALRESEESLRATIEHTPNVAVQWYDAQGRVKFWNRASEFLYGWTASEAANKTLDQLIFGPAETEAFQRALVEISRTGRPRGPAEYPFRRRDGTVGILLSTVFQIQIPSGEPRFVCMDVDLTERKAAESSLREVQQKALRAHEEFTRHLLTAQEQERKRLASELHDSLGQNLSIVKNRLHFARQIPGTPEAVLAHLDAIERVAVEAIAETRNLARNLRPLHIEQIGLTDSLKGLIQEISQSTDIRFERRVEQLDDVLRGEAATHIYRIVQEALNNLVKHSRATAATVTIERDVRSVRVRIMDDGVGFDSQQRPATGGLGLTSLEERARILGGSMIVESAPGKGTRLEFQIPITDAGDEPGSVTVRA